MIREDSAPFEQPRVGPGDVVQVVRGRQSLRNARGLVLRAPDTFSYVDLEMESGEKVTVNNWDVEKI